MYWPKADVWDIMSDIKKGNTLYIMPIHSFSGIISSPT